jgi:hypothetical protein
MKLLSFVSRALMKPTSSVPEFIKFEYGRRDLAWKTRGLGRKLEYGRPTLGVEDQSMEDQSMEDQSVEDQVWMWKTRVYNTMYHQ